MITHPNAELAALGAVGADHWIETLDDGSHVLIRPLRSEDRERERLFLERLSPMTRKFRFHGVSAHAAGARPSRSKASSAGSSASSISAPCMSAIWP